MLGSKPQYTTSNPDTGNNFGMGSSKGTHNGFTGELPDPNVIWGEYFANVMRGNVDKLGGVGNAYTFEVSKTFSDTSTTGEAPPQITFNGGTGSEAEVGAGAGAPDSGFCPTIASAKDADPSKLPADIDGNRLNGFKTGHHGLQRNGSCMNPLAGSDCQKTHKATGPSPTYSTTGQNSSLAAWSD